MNAAASGERPRSGARQFVSPALAIAGWGLLVDAAFETFLDGSVLRWGVVAFVAGASVVLAVVWRRCPWGTRALVAWLGLVGLLSAAAWQPGGLHAGVRMLGQPTSSVLAMLTGAAVVAATTALVRAKALPGAVRTFIGALAAYALASFAWGIAQGTPYPELMRGAGMPASLPRWLHGAVLGALVIVPAAWLVLLVHGAMRVRGRALRIWTVQIVALALVIGTAVAGVRRGADRASGPAPASGPGEASAISQARQLNPEQLDQVVGQLSGAFPRLELALHDVPRETFQVDAVVRSVGSDPALLFRWVRDETFLVPYEGLLRGPTGVLLDRLGNSLDRAILLAALLRAGGHEARLVRGTLTIEQAEQLLRSAPVPQPRTRPSTGPTSSREPSRDSAATALARTAEWYVRHRRILADEASQRTDAQSAAVIRAVRTYRVPDNSGERMAIETLRDHWWVQWSSGSGWLDLDPSLPGHEPGQTLAPATRTFHESRLSDLPDDLLHLIDVRVVIESWHDGRLSEAIPLQHQILPAELIGQRIVLRTVSTTPPSDLDALDPEQARRQLERTLTEQREWLPVLEVGDRHLQQLSFDDVGSLREPGSGVSHGVGQGAEALGGGIRGILAGPGDVVEDSASSKRLTALWIEYVIRSPGRPIRTIRREIFDLIGPGARASSSVRPPEITEARRLERAMALAAETQILPQVSALSRDFVQHVTVSALLSSRDAVLELLVGEASVSLRDFADRIGKLSPLSNYLYTLALVRHEWSGVRNEVYLDRPNILTFREGFRLTDGLEPVGYRSFDIVDNEVAVHRHTEVDAFLARVSQGVLDTNAEALLLRRFGPIDNTAELFSATHLNGGEPWLALRGASDRPPPGSQLAPDVWARIRSDLEEQSLTLVPSRSGPGTNGPFTGWWRVDPRTGTTLGVGDRGWGQAASESTLELQAMVKSVAALTAFVKAYNCLVQTAGAYDPDGVPFEWTVPCAVGLICEFMSLGPNYLDGPEAGINAFQLICNCLASGLEGTNADCLPQSGPETGPGPVASALYGGGRPSLSTRRSRRGRPQSSTCTRTPWTCRLPRRTAATALDGARDPGSNRVTPSRQASS